MSASHANRGKLFEQKLDELHDGPVGYNVTGRASVFRTPPAMKILGRVESLRKRREFGSKPAGPPDFRCCFAGNGPPDYIAQSWGWAFMFDAKQEEGDRWQLDRVPEHQARRFDAHERHQGIAFVLLGAPPPEGRPYDPWRVWLLPWRDLGPRWHARATGEFKRGEASLRLDAMPPWARPVARFDWLTVALTLALDYHLVPMSARLTRSGS